MVVDIFTQKKVQGVYDQLPDYFQKKLDNYYYKWHWTPYGYIGPAYTREYYIEELKKQIDTGDITQLIKEEQTRGANIQEERERLERKISLPADLSHLFAIARDIIWLKDFRKYCMWHGHYVMDMITREIAKRIYISQEQANHLLTTEVEDALLRGKIDQDLINKRIALTMIYVTPEESKYYYGEEAKKILNNLDIEQIEVDESQGFTGTCAYPGMVKGEVKIVNTL